jgi:hypothetical protein
MIFMSYLLKQGLIRIAVSAVFILLIFCNKAGAITIAPDVETGAGVDSAYVWRGLSLSATPCGSLVSGIDMDGILFKLRGFHELDDGENNLARGRLDAVLSYEEKLGRHTLTGGWGGYFYREETGDISRDTQEIFLGYCYSPLSYPALRFSAVAYYDFDMMDGWYAELKALNTVELVGGFVDMDLTLTAGFSDDNYSEYYRWSGAGSDAVPGKAAMTHVSAMLEFPFMFGERFAIVPSAVCSIMADSRIRELAKDNGLDTSSSAYGLAMRMFF